MACSEIDRICCSMGEQLHVEPLGLGLQSSLLSEVRVDVGGYQIVHFVALSGDQTDRNQENEQDKRPIAADAHQ